MKRLLPIVLLLLGCPLHAATWYATSSSANMSSVSWVPTSTGSCTGSGTALVWGNQANGDVFDANGCTSIAVNQDPGTATGASQGVCGTTTVEVTLETDPTNGGGFTYATAADLVMHANVTAGDSIALTISGSTGGGTICGNIAGGATSAGGVQDNHTVVTVYVVGNITGGSGGNAFGYIQSGATGVLNVVGNASAGSGSNSAGLALIGTATMTGNCVGSDSVVSAGCILEYFSSVPSLALTGNIVNGKMGPGIGGLFFTPAATNYIISPADSSYVLGVINSHAQVMTIAPSVSTVLSGTVYGPFTGTLSAAGVSDSGGW